MGFNETVPLGLDPSYYYETQQPQIVGVAAFYIVICIVTVVARFYARYISGVGYWWDDWFALATAPLSISICIINLNTLSLGWGRHVDVVLNTDPSLLISWFQQLFTLLFFYTASLATFKLSALALYCRLFAVCPWLYRSCVSVGALISLWTILAIFLHLFRCDPVSGQWSPQGATCFMNNINYQLMMSIPTIVFSFVTLLLPVRQVWKLHLPPYTRIGIIGVFLLGGFDLVISIVRLHAVVKNSERDITWENVPLFYWSVAESVSGLVSCSLVTYAPLLRAAQRKLGLRNNRRLHSVYFWTQRKRSPYYRSSARRSHGRGFPPDESGGIGTNTILGWTEEGGCESDAVGLTELDDSNCERADGCIHVKQEVQIVRNEQ